MNILVLCDHGQVRSVAMATVLREHGHFAVAGSYDNYDKKADWDVQKTFNRIIEMQEGGEHFIGRDEYGSFDNTDLQEKCVELARKLELIE